MLDATPTLQRLTKQYCCRLSPVYLCAGGDMRALIRDDARHAATKLHPPTSTPMQPAIGFRVYVFVMKKLQKCAFRTQQKQSSILFSTWRLKRVVKTVDIISVTVDIHPTC
jgi:hypothetical protein